MLKFFNPTAEELAERQLRDAEIDLIDHLARAEYHDAMSLMLKDRIERLRTTIETVKAEARNAS